MGEMPLGQPMADDPTDPDFNDVDSMDDAAVEKALEVLEDGTAPAESLDVAELEPPAPAEQVEAPVVETAPEVVEPVAAETVPDNGEVRSEAAPAEAAPVEEEQSFDPMEGFKLQFNQQKAQNELARAKLEAHNSRLAGQIGHLQNQIKDHSPESIRPDADFGAVDTDRISRLEQRLMESEKQHNSESRDRAILEEVTRAETEVKGLDPTAIQDAIKTYEEDWQTALTAGDVSTARLMARAVLGNVVADARTLKWEQDRLSAEKMAVESRGKLATAKAEAASSASGSTSQIESRSRPKSVDDLSEDELDKFIDSRL